MKKEIRFLTLAEIIDINNDQISRYGGMAGIRDIKLLSSAVAMPKTSFGGKFLNENIFQMAAAYAYHICQNHPFVDGNKRVALVSALVFLDINGTEIIDSDDILYDTMIRVASGKGNKEILEKAFKELVIKK